MPFLGISRWALVVSVLLAVGLWQATQWAKGTRLEAMHPTHGPAVQAVYATGTVEATVMMPIAPRISARLMTLNTDEGAQVAKGTVLAELESEDIKASLQDLRAREAYALKEFQRYSKLVRTNAASRATHDRTRAEWESARAAVAKATAELGFMQLTAPADGYIIRRDGEIGQLIPASQPIFWMSCCAPLRISTEVDEEDIALVQPGQSVLIRADAFPSKIFHGTVQSITPKGDPIARSYRVRIGFTEETPLLIGMTAETNIIIRETKDALLVPSAALSNDRVWQVRDGKLIARKVEVGAKGAEQTEITGGITAKDVILSAPPPGLAEGQTVSIRMHPQEE